MNKRQLAAAYNAEHKLPVGYHITGVMVLTDKQVDARKRFGKESLFEVYKKPSQFKIESDKELTRAYEPTEAYYNGNRVSFTVFLKNQYGDYMLITKDNKYLVVVK